MSSLFFNIETKLETEIIKLKGLADLMWANGQSLEKESMSSIGLLLGGELDLMNELLDQLHDAHKQG